jgi:hypothetical protein
MGQSTQEANPVTYEMTQALEDDFFNEVDAAAHGDLSRRQVALHACRQPLLQLR